MSCRFYAPQLFQAAGQGADAALLSTVITGVSEHLVLIHLPTRSNILDISCSQEQLQYTNLRIELDEVVYRATAGASILEGHSTSCRLPTVVLRCGSPPPPLHLFNAGSAVAVSCCSCFILAGRECRLYCCGHPSGRQAGPPLPVH